MSEYTIFFHPVSGYAGGGIHAINIVCCQSVFWRAVEKVHLLRCATNLIAQRISLSASLFRFYAPCIEAFLNSLQNRVFFNTL
jgi:hypothetical protein